ncbi:MAG: protein kinase domain-containing protein [Adlercreutzia equolifaciens]
MWWLPCFKAFPCPGGGPRRAHPASGYHGKRHRERRGEIKAADFAGRPHGRHGSGTTGGGTIGYMPLEQMRQEPLDVRTDEWALASLTYEMLTGSNPFFADDLDAAEEAIEEAELVLPSLCWDELDAEADEVMFAALDPDMDERYEDVAAFSAALSPYLGNAKKGKRVLADIVNGKIEEPAAEEPERVWEPLPRSSTAWGCAAPPLWAVS